MSIKYQVNYEFTLNRGKPSLKNITFNTTKSARTTFPVHSEITILKTYRIFSTFQEAENYIQFLQCVHKKTISPLVLDGDQKNLF